MRPMAANIYSNCNFCSKFLEVKEKNSMQLFLEIKEAIIFCSMYAAKLGAKSVVSMPNRTQSFFLLHIRIL